MDYNANCAVKKKKKTYLKGYFEIVFVITTDC